MLTPMIATSGWLMIGVVASPPRAPSEVMVIVDPMSSLRGRPCRRVPPPATRVISAARSHRSSGLGMAHDRDDQPVRRLGRDADVERVEHRQGAAVGVVVGVEPRLLATGDDEGPHEERRAA